MSVGVEEPKSELPDAATRRPQSVAVAARQLTVSLQPISELQSDWTELLTQARACNVFNSWEFLATWWEHFRRDRESRIFVVYDQTRPIAIVPLCLQSRRGRFGRWRVLRNIGYGDVVNPDFLDALVVPGREDEVADAVAPLLLADPAWQFIELGELDAQGSMQQLARRWETHHGLVRRIDPKSTCPYVPLPASFDAFLAARNSHFRQQLRRYRRVIERELAVEWKRVGLDLSIEDGIAALTHLHQERMEATERGGNFKKSDYQAFHRGLAERLDRSGALFFWVLYSRGEPIATHYGFLHGTTYYGYQMGFTLRHHRYSPGHYMTGVVIEKLIGLGAREMNLLRGTDNWKFRWTETVRQTINISLLRPTAASRWAFNRAGLSLPPALALRFLIGRESFEELRRAWTSWRAPSLEPAAEHKPETRHE
ncbi:MAG: GNAT family N-acetyltransferase [Acidobacteriota bacterium]